MPHCNEVVVQFCDKVPIAASNDDLGDLMEWHQGEEWHRGDEAAKAIAVSETELHRRIDEGLIRAEGFSDAEVHGVPSLRHIRSADVEYMRREALPYPTLERVERGDPIEQPEQPLIVGRPGRCFVYVAARVVRVGRSPAGRGRSHFAIGHDLPPKRWRVLGPGDLVGDEEGENIEAAVHGGEIVRSHMPGRRRQLRHDLWHPVGSAQDVRRFLGKTEAGQFHLQSLVRMSQVPGRRVTRRFDCGLLMPVADAT